MSFRKRSVVVGSPRSESSDQVQQRQVEARKQSFSPTAATGVRPSPVDGRPTTSTGTQSLDDLLAGHAGLALGSSLLIEENGTTDFGGTLLRYYVAEGIVQQHHVHVLGLHESWARDLPGLITSDSKDEDKDMSISGEKMKIAWRYENLGQFGAQTRDQRTTSSVNSKTTSTSVFCHSFDLSKRLALPSQTQLFFCSMQPPSLLRDSQSKSSPNPFSTYLAHLTRHLSNTPPSTIHRVILPNLLSPAIYPSGSSQPEQLLQFLHALRALLRQFPTQLSALITTPLSLYPRSSGLIRWVELLSDGVIELAPFPSAAIVPKDSANPKSGEEQPPQGMLGVHRLPVFHEKGGGGGQSKHGDNFAFSLGRRKGLVIKPYSLPPIEGDSEAQQAGLTGDSGKELSKSDIEF